MALEDNKASFSESGTEGSPSKQAKVNSPSQGRHCPATVLMSSQRHT